jgi:hypothetical protein
VSTDVVIIVTMRIAVVVFRGVFVYIFHLLVIVFRIVGLLVPSSTSKSTLKRQCRHTAQSHSFASPPAQ